MEDIKFLLVSLATDKYMILFSICAVMIPSLAWYLNNWGSDKRDRVPFFNTRATLASTGFLGFGLIISLTEVSIYEYESVKTKQCVSKNHNSTKIVKYLQNRENRTIRSAEFNRLAGEAEACKWENDIEAGLITALGERPINTSSI